MFILANIINAVTYLCHVAVVTYMIIVAVACAVSWFRITPYHPAVRVLAKLTEPVFSRVRRWMPFVCSGGLDFSPVVVIVVLELFDMIVIRSVRQLAMAL